MIFVLYYAHLHLKISPGIFNFLEEISSLFQSIIFLYVYALITEEGFLISACYSLELCIQVGILFIEGDLFFLNILWNSAFSWMYLTLAPLLFTYFLSSADFKASSNNFPFLHFPPLLNGFVCCLL